MPGADSPGGEGPGPTPRMSRRTYIGLGRCRAPTWDEIRNVVGRMRSLVPRSFSLRPGSTDDAGQAELCSLTWRRSPRGAARARAVAGAVVSWDHGESAVTVTAFATTAPQAAGWGRRWPPWYLWRGGPAAVADRVGGGVPAGLGAGGRWRLAGRGDGAENSRQG